MSKRTGLGALIEKLFPTIKGFQQFSPSGSRSSGSQTDGVGAVKSDELDSTVNLEIGNELLITDDIVKNYTGLARSIGRVVIIDNIASLGAKNVKASAFGIQVEVNVMAARSMRQAFLQREQRMA